MEFHHIYAHSIFINKTQKCKTPSTYDGIIPDQFLLELSEPSVDEALASSELDAKVRMLSDFEVDILNSFCLKYESN